MGFIEFKDKGFENVVKDTLKILTGGITVEDLLSLKGVLIAK